MRENVASYKFSKKMYQIGESSLFLKPFIKVLSIMTQKYHRTTFIWIKMQFIDFRGCDNHLLTIGQSSGAGTGVSVSKNFISKDWNIGGPPGTLLLESLSSPGTASWSPGVLVSDWRRSKSAATASARCSPVLSGETAHSHKSFTTAVSWSLLINTWRHE